MWPSYLNADKLGMVLTHRADAPVVSSGATTGAAPEKAVKTAQAVAKEVEKEFFIATKT